MDVEGAGQLSRHVLDERVLRDVHADELRIPLGPDASNANQRMCLGFIVEGEWQRARKAAGVLFVCERRCIGEGRTTADVRGYVEAAFDPAEFVAMLLNLYVANRVVVMREEVARASHQSPVGAAS